MWQDGPVQFSITYKPDVGDSDTHTTTLTVDKDGTTNVTHYQSVLDRAEEPGNSEKWAYRNGSRGAIYTDDFDQSYEALNSYHQGSGAATYTVRGGETLTAIAASLYGDASLWYKIAQVNGLSSPNAPLIEGQSLTLPAGVVRTSHNADTFTPYDPGDTIGAINPIVPEGKDAKCGVFGQILLAVIAISTTVILTAAGVPAPIAAALGSANSQAHGVALGIQDKFDLKAVGRAGLNAFITGGVSPASSFKEVAIQAGKAAALNAASQGIANAVGLQDGFSWTSVAAAGVSGGLGARLKGAGFDTKIETWAGGDTFGEAVSDIAMGAASSLANAATRSAIDGTNFGDNIVASIPDIIGQAVGNALGDSFIKGLGLDTRNTSAPTNLYAQNTNASSMSDMDEIIVQDERSKGFFVRIGDAAADFVESGIQSLGFGVGLVQGVANAWWESAKFVGNLGFDVLKFAYDFHQNPAMTAGRVASAIGDTASYIHGAWSDGTLVADIGQAAGSVWSSFENYVISRAEQSQALKAEGNLRSWAGIKANFNAGRLPGQDVGAIWSPRIALKAGGKLVDGMGDVIALSRAEINVPDNGGSVWSPSSNFKRPRSIYGNFSGAEGYSYFILTKEGALKHGVPEGTRIPWREGIPDFSEFAVRGPSRTDSVFNVEGLDGSPSGDASLIISHVARLEGMTQGAVRAWARQNEVRFHHSGGSQVQIVPARLHALKHSGGAERLRRTGQ